MNRALFAIAAAALGALALGCKSARDGLPPGKGLVSFDREPPDGAEVVEAPRWKAGDRFVYRKGGLIRIAMHVDAIEEDGDYRLVEEASGLTTVLGSDLGEKGQLDADHDELARTLDPADQVLCFPLWAGKRWSSHFVSRAPGRDDVPLFVTYHADAWEEIAVPAGRLRTLRIWRRARVALEGDYLERVSCLWYAPEVGAIARRLDDGLLTELEEFQRQ
jgi:hypothetical protein